MEKTGQLIWKSEVETGVSKAGKSFSKMSFAIQEKNVKFENKVAFETLSSELIQMISDTTLNSEITVYFDVKSREYSGKWYTSASAFKAEVVKNDWNMVTEQSDFNRSNNQRAAQLMKENPSLRTQATFQGVPVEEGDDKDLPF